MFFLDNKSLYSSSAFSNMAITFLFTRFSSLQNKQKKYSKRHYLYNAKESGQKNES